MTGFFLSHVSRSNPCHRKVLSRMILCPCEIMRESDRDWTLINKNTSCQKRAVMSQPKSVERIRPWRMKRDISRFSKVLHLYSTLSLLMSFFVESSKVWLMFLLFFFLEIGRRVSTGTSCMFSLETICNFFYPHATAQRLSYYYP